MKLQLEILSLWADVIHFAPEVESNSWQRRAAARDPMELIGYLTVSG